MLGPFIAAVGSLTPLLRKWADQENNDMLNAAIETAQALTGKKEPHDICRSLKSDPHLLYKFHQKIIELEIKQEKAETKDRQSARQRDITLIQAGRTNRRADIMVIAAACGLLACLLAITYFASQMPGEAVGIISTVAGIFGSCLKDAYTFEFGSSRGSRTKDSTVAALLDRA